MHKLQPLQSDDMAVELLLAVTDYHNIYAQAPMRMLDLVKLPINRVQNVCVRCTHCVQSMTKLAGHDAAD